ncbi:MAG: hypothetical protein VYC82_04345 [Verrucomicrobiota bacterium]|nr:hypothetical protein [Verrucomicrobiota bacterium]
MTDYISQSLESVQNWVEERDYKGYDPGDGLTSFLRPLTLGQIFPERLLQQLIWKSPINIRPLVGVKPLDSTKGRGFMAWGYLMRYKATSDETYRDKAQTCLDWLDKHIEQGHAGHCWGNHFDFTTRSGRMVAHTPTIVWSGLIGQSYLEAFEQTQDQKYLDTAESICRWILSLPREKTAIGDCLSYVPKNQSSVHNSNLLGAGMLARTWKHSPKDEYIETARRAALYSCDRQLDDGSWWYAETKNHHWIDNFHTAYNLDSLKRYAESTQDESFNKHIDSGYQYFKEVFFEEDGIPRYYHNRKHPIDIQCASQAIDTFCHFSDEDTEAISMAEKVARWTIGNIQDSTGYFYYRKYPVLTAKTPYFHWGQATMFKALSHLKLKINFTSAAKTKPSSHSAFQ